MAVAEVPSAPEALRFNPLAPENWHDPYPTYRRLRDEAPLHYCAESNCWTVSRFDDVASVLRQTEAFSSVSAFDVLFQLMTEDLGWRDFVAFARFFLRGRVSMQMLKAGPTESMIVQDPPEHDALRNIVNRGFTPKRIAAWESRIDEIVEECMKGLDPGRPFDVIHDLAIPVPVQVIAEMLGVEPEDRAAFKDWSDKTMAGISSPDRKRARPAFMHAMTDMSRYLHDFVEKRRQNPQDDLISILVDPSQGETLTPQKILQFVMLLLVAGNETTTNAIGNCVVALLRNPDQLERLAAEPELIPSAVEETIRYDGPVQFIFRRATRDVELADGVIPEDARVIPLIGSANRDERKFEDPDRFDVTRDARGHLGFGFGVHFCLGASLARLEAHAALRQLVPELPRLRAIGDLDNMVDSVLVRGREHILLERSA